MGQRKFVPMKFSNFGTDSYSLMVAYNTAEDATKDEVKIIELEESIGD